MKPPLSSACAPSTRCAEDFLPSDLLDLAGVARRPVEGGPSGPQVDRDRAIEQMAQRAAKAREAAQHLVQPANASLPARAPARRP